MNTNGLSPAETEMYSAMICEPCKKKITEATSKLGASALLRPTQTAVKIAKLLCAECTMKVRKSIGG